MVPLARGGLVPHENGIGRCDLPLGRAMLAARKTRNLRGSFRPRLPWTEKRPERFRNYRPERSTFQCSRTATANRSTHIIPHGSGQRESLEPRESCCKERIQAKRFPDPAQNQKRPARNREVFITQRWLAPALLVALVLRRNEAPGQQNAS